ncbi:MAG: aspartate--tRNA(Asn) ligase, partial [Thaumarchaeota archaeon]
PQLYKEQLTVGLERVFEIASFYRAEKSHTVRHLTEFTSVDIESSFMDYTDVMEVLEKVVTNVFDHVSKNCIEEQKTLGIQVKRPDIPFKLLTYNQAIQELDKNGISLEFGDDLLDSHLRKLGEIHPGFYFITDWPIKLKPFYIHENEADQTLSKSFDLQYGYLELSSGGRRLHDPKKIRSRLVEQGLNPAQFENHLRSFDWGMPPHSGWGLGLDRLMSVLTQIDNVREVVLYPRDPERLFP